MKIKINNKEYTIKYSLRAMIVFEKITKKSFAITTFTDQLVFLYSLLLANNPDMTLTMDELINYCDEDSSILSQYASFLQGTTAKDAMLNGDDGSSDKKKE